MIIDIDHFKNFNDQYGHQTGDQILRLVSQALRRNLKGRDLAARYGGEEFAIILQGANGDDAFTVAEQIRSSIAAKELIKRSSGERLGSLTISTGIAEIAPGDDCKKLIERADQALYQAKNNGRNRSIIGDGKSVATDPQIEAEAGNLAEDLADIFC